MVTVAIVLLVFWVFGLPAAWIGGCLVYRWRVRRRAARRRRARGGIVVPFGQRRVGR